MSIPWWDSLVVHTWCYDSNIDEMLENTALLPKHHNILIQMAKTVSCMYRSCIESEVCQLVDPTY